MASNRLHNLFETFSAPHLAPQMPNHARSLPIGNEGSMGTMPGVMSETMSSPESFVACPGPLLASLPTAQHALVCEIYRIARERTEAQLRAKANLGKERLPFPPRFSLN